MRWSKETLWFLVVGLSMSVALRPSWPVALVLVAVAAAACFSDRLAHDTTRREVLGEEVLSQLSSVSQRVDTLVEQAGRHEVRLTTVENRTRPVGR